MGGLIFGLLFDLVCGPIVWAVVVAIGALFYALKRLYMSAQDPRAPKSTNPRRRRGYDPLAPKYRYAPTPPHTGAQHDETRVSTLPGVGDDPDVSETLTPVPEAVTPPGPWYECENCGAKFLQESADSALGAVEDFDAVFGDSDGFFTSNEACPACGDEQLVLHTPPD